jgi:hypothetical protein
MPQREIDRPFGDDEIDDEISVVTEQMDDGRWAVAVTVVHSTEGARQAIPLPMTHERFDNEPQARDAGLRMGREWIERNMPVTS